MIRKSLVVLLFVFTLAAGVSAQTAQTAQTSNAEVSVPRMIRYTGKLKLNMSVTDGQIVGVSFALYKEQEGGAPLWMETQNVKIDTKGSYTVQLGSTRNDGLPVDLFTSKESRWLGVQVSGQNEQPRTLLLSVPYALKAADSETLGGLPASAFMLAAPFTTGSTSGTGASAASGADLTPATAISGTGTTNFLPLWTSASALGNSALLQSGTGTTAKVGINTTTPSTTLDVKGTSTLRGAVTLPAISAATASAGKNSQPQNLVASAFNSGSSTAVNQTFRWQAEAVGNNTANAAGSLNLLFGQGSAAPKETGLKVASNGQITFAAGQTFPGGGSGGVSSVGLSAPSSDFTVSGSPITSSGTLALKWTTAPTSGNTANAIVKRDSTGSFNGGIIGASELIANSGTTGNIAVSGISSSSSGVYGGSTGNAGVYGVSASGSGLYGNSTSGRGIFGQSTSNQGVEGDTTSASAYGVFGYNSAINGIAIYGSTSGSTGTGMLGYGNVGVKGISASIDGTGAGVYALGRVGGSGLYASSDDDGWAVNAYNVGSGTGVLAGSFAGFAAWFNGAVEVDGNLSKEGGSFKIDHPLDPANKYLYHSFVESPDMMNIYNGNVTTNAAGEAVVTLPEWFESLNRDFRYQLTVLGQFAQAIVASEVANHTFSIKTDKPNVKVSWQVTGVRHDAWANAHRIPVEEEKSAQERGFYLRPELFGAPEEKSVLWAREPRAMKQWKESRTKPVSAPRTDASAKP